MRRLLFVPGFIVLAFSFLSSVADAQSIQLFVDLSDAPRNLYHSRLTIPVKPGPLTLVYPEWIPGNHRPAGPIANVTGIKMEAGVRHHHQRQQRRRERACGDDECSRLELEPGCALSAGCEFGRSGSKVVSVSSGRVEIWDCTAQGKYGPVRRPQFF